VVEVVVFSDAEYAPCILFILKDHDRQPVLVIYMSDTRRRNTTLDTGKIRRNTKLDEN
jgi:hypothetical protein